MGCAASLQGILKKFRAGEFHAVVASCSDALLGSPDDIDLQIVLARALLALREDCQAQHCLRAILRAQPDCVQAHRLLGELALRRRELASAELFLKEALRIDEGDQSSVALLRVVHSLVQPIAVVEKLPAATAAVGCPSSDLRKPRRAQSRPPRLAAGTANDCRSQFGGYLVRVGILSKQQLTACLALQSRQEIRIGDAAVELGFVSSPKLEWASLAYHSQRPPTG